MWLIMKAEDTTSWQFKVMVNTPIQCTNAKNKDSGEQDVVSEHLKCVCDRKTSMLSSY